MPSRLTRNHYRWQEGTNTLLPAGTIVEPTPEELRAFPDLFVQVETAEEGQPAPLAPPAEVEPSPPEEEAIPTPESVPEPPADEAPAARRRR